MSTERRNPRSVDIDLFPAERILRIINAEDAQVAGAVSAAIPDIAKVVDAAVKAIGAGGRIIYVGAGTSGRLAALDAAECPPTFSTPREWVQALLAGGPKALLFADEGSEDDRDKAIALLKSRKITSNDIVIGIAASGDTPYTYAALDFSKGRRATTVAIVCVPGTPMTKIADISVCVDVGPEVVTGSTRLKAGTAQKMVLNMISTATMIRLGMTYSNWMINVAMTNRKLRDRGIHILQEILGVNTDEAARLADAADGKLKVAVAMGAVGCNREEAEKRLEEAKGNLREVLGHLGAGRE
jgi:N-acetylmuramic acid 6-phosphate etherase